MITNFNKTKKSKNIKPEFMPSEQLRHRGKFKQGLYDQYGKVLKFSESSGISRRKRQGFLVDIIYRLKTFLKRIIQWPSRWHKKRKYYYRSRYRKPFIRKKSINPILIKPYQLRLRIGRRPQLSQSARKFYNKLYKKIKIKIRKIESGSKNSFFKRQINTKILARLRTKKFRHKFQKHSTQRFNGRPNAGRQKKYKKPHIALISWCYYHIKSNSQYRCQKKLSILRKSNGNIKIRKNHKHRRDNNRQNFGKNIMLWIQCLKLSPLYFSILFKKWKLSAKSPVLQNFANTTSCSKVSILRCGLRLTGKRTSHSSYVKRNFILRKLLQNIQSIQLGARVTNYKLYSKWYKISKALTINRRNQHGMFDQLLSNLVNFKWIYKREYKTSLVEKIQDVLKNKYREAANKPPGKFLRGPRIQRLKYPWLPQMISKKRAHSLQYFNSYRSIRTPWARKSNKIYRTFMWVTKHKHEKVKLKLGTRGGNRAIHFKLNLLKVILPFYGNLKHKQFNKIWQTYIFIKSHHQGRHEQFHEKLNTTLCLLIQQLGWAPNTFWAQNIIKNGWISVSKTNPVIGLKDGSVQQLFPLFNDVGMKLNKQNYQINEAMDPFYQVKRNEILQIHPHIKMFCKQFFLRRLNWNRRRLPNFMEINSTGTNALIVNPALYYKANTKNRSKKNFLRYILD